jgi:hypothetical protein
MRLTTLLFLIVRIASTTTNSISILQHIMAFGNTRPSALEHLAPEGLSLHQARPRIQAVTTSPVYSTLLPLCQIKHHLFKLQHPTAVRGRQLLLQ